MKHTDRRALLKGLGGAAMMAASGPVNAQPKATPRPLAKDHMAAMEKVMGKGAYGQEQIAMLLYPGFTALDFVGPHYYFGCMMGATVHLVTTEADLSPVKSDLGLAIAPTIRMADVPDMLDVLFIPGGTQGTLDIMQRRDVMGWIKDRASRAKHLTSVCTGSMVLAKAGLLKGKRATSHWTTRPILADYGVIPVDERVVADGNVLTGAGVSAGIDFAITLVEQLRGRNYAAGLMLQSEYAPKPPFAGGTIATTPEPITAMLQHMSAETTARFNALAR
jgi:cyclohexyl-isocyanide hydratase